MSSVCPLTINFFSLLLSSPASTLFQLSLNLLKEGGGWKADPTLKAVGERTTIVYRGHDGRLA